MTSPMPSAQAPQPCPPRPVASLRRRLLPGAVLCLLALAALAADGAAPSAEIYVNGVRVTGLRAGEMAHCSVKFDADGNVHVLAPGYRVVTDNEGKPLRIEGQSDYAGRARPKAAATSRRHVLVYEPNAKVPFTFEIQVNGKPFRQIDLGTPAFTVDVSSRLQSGDNTIRVVGKPAGEPPAHASEADVVKLRILAGEEREDGTFVAKLPAVWELVRSAVDRDPIDRTQTLSVE